MPYLTHDSTLLNKNLGKRKKRSTNNISNKSAKLEADPVELENHDVILEKNENDKNDFEKAEAIDEKPKGNDNEDVEMLDVGDKIPDPNDKIPDGGNNEHEVDDKILDGGDNKPQIDEPKVDDNKPDEGDNKLDEGDNKLDGGDNKNAADDKIPDGGDNKPEVDDKIPAADDKKLDEGNKNPEADDEISDGGDSINDEISDGGDSINDEISDGGDSIKDELLKKQYLNSIELYISRGYCTRNNGREQYYAKNAENNEYYFSDSTGEPIYAYRIKENNNLSEREEYPITLKDGTSEYIYNHAEPRYPENLETRKVIFPVDPITKEEMYLPTAGGQTIYPKNIKGDEFYRRDKNNNEVPINNTWYASYGDGSQFYPKTANGDEYYLHPDEGNSEIVAQKIVNKKPIPFYAKKANGDEFYPRMFF